MIYTGRPGRRHYDLVLATTPLRARRRRRARRRPGFASHSWPWPTFGRHVWLLIVFICKRPFAPSMCNGPRPGRSLRGRHALEQVFKCPMASTGRGGEVLRPPTCTIGHLYIIDISSTGSGSVGQRIDGGTLHSLPIMGVGRRRRTWMAWKPMPLLPSYMLQVCHSSYGPALVSPDGGCIRRGQSRRCRSLSP